MITVPLPTKQSGGSKFIDVHGPENGRNGFGALESLWLEPDGFQLTLSPSKNARFIGWIYDLWTMAIGTREEHEKVLTFYQRIDKIDLDILRSPLTAKLIFLHEDRCRFQLVARKWDLFEIQAVAAAFPDYDLRLQHGLSDFQRIFGPSNESEVALAGQPK